MKLYKNGKDEIGTEQAITDKFSQNTKRIESLTVL
jgi:hypothetical protein